MTKTWIQTLTLALALTGCSSSESQDDDKADPSTRDAGNSKPRDAAPTKQDSDDIGEEDGDEPPPDKDETGKDAPRDAATKGDASKADLKDASSDGVDARSSNGKQPDPRCVRDAGPNSPPVVDADPLLGDDDWISQLDGTIVTTEGTVFRVPGAGVVFGQQNPDSCVVTVAETGVKTTIYGGGIVCHNNQVIAVGTKCQTDASGNPVKP